MGVKDEVEVAVDKTASSSSNGSPPQMERLRIESESASSDGGLEGLEPLELDDIKNYYADCK